MQCFCLLSHSFAYTMLLIRLHILYRVFLTPTTPRPQTSCPGRRTPSCPAAPPPVRPTPPLSPAPPPAARRRPPRAPAPRPAATPRSVGRRGIRETRLGPGRRRGCWRGGGSCLLVWVCCVICEIKGKRMKGEGEQGLFCLNLPLDEAHAGQALGGLCLQARGPTVQGRIRCHTCPDRRM